MAARELLHRYRVGRSVVHSVLDLPGAAPAPDALDVPDILVRHSAHGRPFVGRELYRDDDEAPSLRIARTETCYELRFEGQCALRVTPGRPIDVALDPSCAEAPEEIPHVVIDQVLPRVLAWIEEAVVLHAGGAILGGQAVLFCGASGAGKTSLSVGLATRGARFLSDDAVLLRSEGSGGWTAEPVRGGARRLPPGAGAHSEKQFLAELPGVEHQPLGQPVPVAAVYVLADPPAPAASEVLGTDVRIERIPGAEACLTLVASAFRLALDRPDLLARELNLLSAPDALSRVWGVHADRGSDGVRRTLDVVQAHMTRTYDLSVGPS